MKCSRCDSEKVKVIEILGSEFLQCEECGLDESEEFLEVYPEGRSTQSQKGKFSPYKKGGSLRTKK